MHFEWDGLKAKRNERKHGVTFVEAMSCFYDSHQIAFYDPDHSEDEYREILIASWNAGKVVEFKDILSQGLLNAQILSLADHDGECGIHWRDPSRRIDVAPSGREGTGGLLRRRR